MANYQQPNVLPNTAQFFEKAYPQESTPQNISTQLGVHAEEFAETLAEITPNDPDTLAALMDAKVAVQHLADHLKGNAGCVQILPENRKGFLDGLLDTIVTSVGSAHHTKMDIVGGLAEVNRSNFSKFDDDGNPIFDENMKVQKGPNYTKPDLTPFI